VTQTCSCFVLAGGKSSRFGANKSLALVGSQPMALVVANNLQTAFGSAARLVGSDAQTSSQIGLVSISGPREGNGPLAAIIDAMESCTNSLVAFAPNDTPFFSADNFSALLAKIT
jgi:molybdopterin-guanine dinucleotide biosynthesis protein A